jgi:predicted patatin/cPLA2 family phospholipase
VSPVRVIEKEPSVLYDFSSEKPRVSPDGWMETLRDATPRKGGTARCDPSARPGAGVRAVRQFWRRGDASSYERAAVDGVGETSSSGASHLADHPVLAALARRLRDGTAPGSRAASDTMKIGLAVEGGGMKGVVSAGACGELLRLGLYDCFDAVYGSSAGAMNLTYYLAKQPEGVKAYQEDLVDGAFLDLKRLPKTRRSRRLMGTSRGRAPAMDVSYLVDGVMDGATGRALRWSDVLASTVAFNVVATSLDTLTPVILHSPFQNVRDLKTALKASAAVPLFAGPKPVRHRGQRLVDAAVMEPVPVHAAIADGCTHILVLCTRSLPPLGEKMPASTADDPAVPPSSITADSLVPAAAGNGGSSRPDGGMFFSRVGGFLDRRRRRGPAPSAAGGDGDVAMVEASENTSEKKKRKNFIVKALGGMLYQVVRGALLTPPHMKDAWATYDLHRRLHDESEGGEMQSLDDALLLARDDPSAATEAKTFPGGAHVYPIAPPVSPKGVGSLCQERELLAAANEAGREAAEAVLVPLLNRNIASWN